MITRRLKTKQGEYEHAPWSGQNTSGIEPVCDRVVVLPDKHVEKSGLVFIPSDIAERQSIGATTGILVAAGPQAFTYDSSGLNRWDGMRPEPGMRVCFQRYAGEEYMGDDEQLYRVMDYRAIAGTRGKADVQEAGPVIVTGGGITMSSSAEEAA